MEIELSFTCKNLSLFYARVICAKEEWVNLSSQEFTEVQISKLKLKLYRKNKECILVIDFIYTYSNCSVKLNIDKKIIDTKVTQKCTTYQEIRLLKANFRIECTWVKSPLLHEQNLLKQVSVQNVLYEKLWSLDPLYGQKLTYFIQPFSNDKEKF